MKKILFVFIFISLFIFESFAPESISKPFIETKPKETISTQYDDIFFAVTMVESRGNPNAYNSKENAVGLAQIRQIRIDDYNARTGDSLSLNDAYDPFIAKKIFVYYADLIGKENRDLIIRKWNGSGPMTYEYLKKVKHYLTVNKPI